jgi:threonine/homoserine/homoserine lactone efflux protein
LLRGLALGFSIAAPVGPIGVLCIQRTLNAGRLVGFVTGLGAATADLIYASLGVLGLTLVAQAVIAGRLWLHVVGGLFLVYLGARTFFGSPAKRAAATTGGRGIAAAYASTVGLTLTNPATIFSFAAIFAGLGVGAGSAASAVTLVGGVFLGSALWWLLLSNGVALFRSALGPLPALWINRLSGAIILAFGVIALATLL